MEYIIIKNRRPRPPKPEPQWRSDIKEFQAYMGKESTPTNILNQGILILVLFTIVHLLYKFVN